MMDQMLLGVLIYHVMTVIMVTVLAPVVVSKLVLLAVMRCAVQH